MTTRFMAVTAIGLMVIGSAALAQDNGNTVPNGNTNSPAATGKLDDMIGSTNRTQMQRMMENCNRMMESQMKKAPAPDKKG